MTQPAHRTQSINPVFITFTRTQTRMTSVLYSIRKGPRKLGDNQIVTLQKVPLIPCI